MTYIGLEMRNVVYCVRADSLNLDSARQSQIETLRSERRSSVPSGLDEKEDRFSAVAASPNLKNLPARSINHGILSFLLYCLIPLFGTSPEIPLPQLEQIENPSPLTATVIIPC